MLRQLKTPVCMLLWFVGISIVTSAIASDNQTDDLTPILSQSLLPFSVNIELANFQLPNGVHSGVVGVYQGKWVFIAGRTNGLHGFGVTDNFPVPAQNTTVYVVNLATGTVSSRSLTESSSGLSQRQIDTLSVTSPQWYQDGSTLYMTGGYGIDTATSTFDTKPVLTAINLPGIIEWVMSGGKSHSVVQNIRQIYNPIFQITGGKMFKLGNVTQLVFGQNFVGEYSVSSNGSYSQQIRRFIINNTGGKFSVTVLPCNPANPDPNYRRRDLNIVPALLNSHNQLKYAWVAYSGVFTAATGVWTVPVVIDGAGNPSMANPDLVNTFKQGMNHYVCATASLYSNKYANTYHIFLGGISYGFYLNGVYTTDNEIPFINQVTTVQMDKNNHFSQYLMNNEYPVILSTGANPGNQLLFGAAAYFIPTNIDQYANKVINLDSIRQATVIGYIVGGIQSTLANTNIITDSSASPYIFKVTLTPKSIVRVG